MAEHDRWQGQRIFLYRHPVDMRKQIDALAEIVATEFGRNPADRCTYVFSNKGRDKTEGRPIKLLIWHLNAYWLMYKRTERQRFHWPDWFDDDALVLSQQEL